MRSGGINRRSGCRQEQLTNTPPASLEAAWILQPDSHRWAFESMASPPRVGSMNRRKPAYLPKIQYGESDPEWKLSPAPYDTGAMKLEMCPDSWQHRQLFIGGHLWGTIRGCNLLGSVALRPGDDLFAADPEFTIPDSDTPLGTGRGWPVGELRRRWPIPTHVRHGRALRTQASRGRTDAGRRWGVDHC
jgi:hypothetical protein